VDPTLLRTGGLRISAYGLFLLAGLALGLYRFVRTCHRAGLGRAEALDLGLNLALVALLGARAGYVLAHAGAYVQDPVRALWVWQDRGLAFYGGVAACVLCCRLLRSDRWVQILDVLAAPAALGYTVGALGTLWVFVGRPTDLPWAVEVAGTLRHPVGAYLALASLAAYRLLEGRTGAAGSGQALLAYLVLQGTARFAAEAFVDPVTTSAVAGPLTLGQLSAAVVAAAGAVGLWWGRRGAGEGGSQPG